ncbi:MAG: ion transporter [Pseudomonadales bacterium]
MTSESDVALRDRVRIIIFEAETPAGAAFDVALILAILASVAAVMLDTVPVIHERYGNVLYIVEWVFTGLFLLEYLIRLWCIRDSKSYAFSFFGVIDLLCVLPSFIGLFVGGAQNLLVVRILRVLRVFRVLRMVRYVSEANLLMDALRASSRKIIVFVSTVITMVIIFGALMYLVEGSENGFNSIPQSVYWAVTTLSTVGYGDITPKTPVGQALATIVMILGYGIIAVPTGIITLEMNEAHRRRANTRTCAECSAEGHSNEASYCWRCGSNLFRKAEVRVEPGLTEIPRSGANSIAPDSATDPAADKPEE